MRNSLQSFGKRVEKEVQRRLKKRRLYGHDSAQLFGFFIPGTIFSILEIWSMITGHPFSEIPYGLYVFSYVVGSFMFYFGYMLDGKP